MRIDCQAELARHELTCDQPAERGKPITWHCACGWSTSAPKRKWFQLKQQALRHPREAVAEQVRAIIDQSNGEGNKPA